MNTTLPNAEQYPQFTLGETASPAAFAARNNGFLTTEIQYFRVSPAIQNRPSQIVEFTEEPNGLLRSPGAGK